MPSNAPANCDHPSMSGVDTTPSDDPEKVWECHSCGRLYRFEGVLMIEVVKP